jgi:hypothetical protein
VTIDEMKKVLRMTMPDFKPQYESLLYIAIGESAQVLWNRAQWSFRKKEYSVTSTGSETIELDNDIDSVLNVKYGTNDTPAYPTLSVADQDKLTIVFDPVIESGESITITALKKLDYGDVSVIPGKLHGLILRGAKNFLKLGDVITPDLLSLIDMEVLADRPIIRTRYAMGRDAYQSSQVDETNSIRSGSNQDIDHPID